MPVTIVVAAPLPVWNLYALTRSAACTRVGVCRTHRAECADYAVNEASCGYSLPWGRDILRTGAAGQAVGGA